MRVLFRADSSAVIGSGHVRRCLALAASLSRRGAACVFAARALPGNINDAVAAAGHQIIALPGDGSVSVEADAAQTLAAITGDASIDLIVVDHYSLDERWERALLTRVRRCAAIDDLADRRHACDVLIDVAPGEHHAALYDSLLSADALTLLGPRYALLRPEFGALRRAIKARRGDIRRVLISYGAIDQDNCCAAAYRATRQALGEKVEIDIVIGHHAPHLSELQHLADRDQRMRLHIDTPDMAALMASADVAIGAGGTTSWERACLGLPAIVTATADNQRDTAQSLVEARAALSVEAGDQYETRLQQAVAVLASDPKRLAAMSAAAAQLVDGKGADRIAAILMRLDITLRPAIAQDGRDLWRWRNEPGVRQASNNTDPIEWDEHRVWFEATLANPDRHLLIGESDGAPAGVLRFDVAGDEAMVSVYLTPQGRGRGVGPTLLMQGQAWLQSNLPQIARINAQIRPGNAASIAAFEAARYRRQGEHYVREVPHEPAKTH